jgi:hypothetical protein
MCFLCPLRDTCERLRDITGMTDRVVTKLGLDVAGDGNDLKSDVQCWANAFANALYCHNDHVSEQRLPSL